MHPLRAFILRHRALAAWLVALALVMKAVVPQGMMIGNEAHTLTIRICDGFADHRAPDLRAIVVKADPAGAGDKSGKAAPDHQACPFSALTQAGLAGADPIQLALALAFIVIGALRAPPIPARRVPARLRPPLRAPPLPA